jgi:hypothetical protein
LLNVGLDLKQVTNNDAIYFLGGLPAAAGRKSNSDWYDRSCEYQVPSVSSDCFFFQHIIIFVLVFDKKASIEQYYHKKTNQDCDLILS